MGRSSVNIGVQFGLEATKGTAVAANKKILGLTVSPSPEVETKQFRPSGFTAPTVSQVLSEMTTADVEGPIDYRSIVYPLSVFGKVTPTAGTTGNTAAKTWVWNYTGKGELNPATYSVEVGDVSDAAKFGYGVFDSVKLAISKKAENQLTGSMKGQRMTFGATMTASPTEVDIMPLSGLEWDVFIDPTSVALGTTKLDNLWDADLDFSDLFTEEWTIDSTKPSFTSLLTNAEPNFSWGMTVGADSTLATHMSALRSGTKRFIRLKAEGAVIPTATSKFSIQIDMCVAITGVGSLGDSDGAYTAELDFTPMYDTTWGKAMQITVVNDIAAL